MSRRVGIRELLGTAVAASLRFRRASLLLGAGLALAAIAATVPGFALLSSELGPSPGAARLLRGGLLDPVADLLVHEGPAVSAAAVAVAGVAIPVLLLGLLLGIGLALMVARDEPSPALAGLFGQGARRFGRGLLGGLWLALLGGAAAMVVSALAGAILRAAKEPLDLALLDDRVAFALAAARFAAALAGALLLRGAWDLLRVDLDRPGTGTFRQALSALLFALRRPVRTLLLQAGGALAGLLLFALPAAIGLLGIPADTLPRAFARIGLVLAGLVLAPLPRAGVLAAMARWREAEREDAAVEAIPAGAAAIAEGDEPSDEVESEIGSSSDDADSDSDSDTVVVADGESGADEPGGERPSTPPPDHPLRPSDTEGAESDAAVPDGDSDAGDESPRRAGESTVDGDRDASSPAGGASAAGDEPDAFALPASPDAAPEIPTGVRRASNMITRRLVVPDPAAPPPTFPATLPRGIGVEVMSVSKRTAGNGEDTHPAAPADETPKLSMDLEKTAPILVPPVSLPDQAPAADSPSPAGPDAAAPRPEGDDAATATDEELPPETAPISPEERARALADAATVVADDSDAHSTTPISPEERAAAIAGAEGSDDEAGEAGGDPSRDEDDR